MSMKNPPHYDVAQAQAREDEIEVERYEPQPV